MPFEDAVIQLLSLQVNLGRKEPICIELREDWLLGRISVRCKVRERGEKGNDVDDV